MPLSLVQRYRAGTARRPAGALIVGYTLTYWLGVRRRLLRHAT